MDECVDCGRETLSASAYCDQCADRAAPERVASPTARAVAVLLAAGALVGGATVLQSLQYAPAAIRAGRPLDAVGFLAVQAVNAALVVAFAAMAKRLFEGRGDRARYGRILRVLAVASVASGTLVAVLPNTLVRWLPTVLDPASAVVNVLAFFASPSVFVDQWQTLALGVVGAAISFAAGTALQRDAVA